MALRKILTEGDEQLLKHSRKVEKFDDRLHTLIDDMRETLENSGGVGLAAPQVGILRRVVVLLDVNKEPEEMVELVNPEVIEQKGSERVVEGCLSVPGVYGYVTRPTWAKISSSFLSVFGWKTGISCSSASVFTGGAVRICLRPCGLSGWVYTAQTSCPASMSACRLGTAKSGVPMNTIRIIPRHRPA